MLWKAFLAEKNGIELYTERKRERENTEYFLEIHMLEMR